MYCPKCKKDIKPGTEKMKMHKTGVMLVCVGAGYMILAPILLGSDPLYAATSGGISCLGYSIAKPFARRATRFLLPENPFDDS